MARDPQTKHWRLVRSGGTPPDRDVLIQRVRPFGATLGQLGGASLLAYAHDDGLAGYVSLPNSGTQTEIAVSTLATALSAKAEPVDELPDLMAGAQPHLGWLVARPSTFASRDTQAGGDPSETAVLLSRVLHPGQWAAVTMRRASKTEWSRTQRWFEHRLGGIATHYSRESEAVLCTIYAGGGSKESVRSTLTQLAATMPGFDIEVDVQMPATGRGTAVALSAMGVAGWLAGGIELSDWRLASLGGGIVCAGGLVAASGHMPSRSARVAEDVASGVLPPPARRLAPPARPRRESTRQGANGTTRQVSARPGGWPLAPSTFLLGPAMVVGVVAPHAGGSSDSSTTKLRPAPPALIDDIGPMVGYAGEDHRPVHIDAAAAYAGVALIGLAGSGKTQAAFHIWAWYALERTRPSGKPSRPGQRSTTIAFESKGEGAAQWVDWGRRMGDDPILVEVANPDTPAIDLFPNDGTISERAARFVNSLVYAFGDGAIQDRSFEVLSSVFIAALTLHELPGYLSAEREDTSPVALAHILLGGLGDEAGQRLAAELAGAAVEAGPKSPAAEAAARLGPIYGPGITPAARRNLIESSRNKVAQLMEASSWWRTDRERISWSALLEGHRSVVVNTGSDTRGHLTTERLSTTLSAMLAYHLREAIMSTCSGWQAKGRSVAVFADELKLLAENSADVVVWLRNQGRSFGVRCVFAAQYPEQLLPAVRTALLSFGTVFWFRQNVASVVTEAVNHLSMLGTGWTPQDIAGMEQFHAIVSATAKGSAQPPVPVRMAYWGEGDSLDASAFAADQGYGLGPVGAAAVGHRPPAPGPNLGSTPPPAADPYLGGGGEW